MHERATVRIRAEWGQIRGNDHSTYGKCPESGTEGLTGIAAQKELRVKINNRVILSPYAAKRLAALMTNVVGEYEKRFGSLGD